MISTLNNTREEVFIITSLNLVYVLLLASIDVSKLQVVSHVCSVELLQGYFTPTIRSFSTFWMTTPTQKWADGFKGENWDKAFTSHCGANADAESAPARTE